MRVLIVAGRGVPSRALRQPLEEGAFAVAAAHDAGAARDEACSGKHDVVLLDLSSLPDGLSLIRGLREAGVMAPVLAVSAGTVEDKVRGLDAGADDFLTLPFEAPELVARVRALGRRWLSAMRPILRVGDLEIDRAARQVKRGGDSIPLTRREFALLEFLASRRGNVATRSMILESVWPGSRVALSNVVDATIRNLRNKIDRGYESPLILTRWGEGYLLRGA
ncbi:MAG: response regulator transcription factor [Gemmataceae bacterium]|nr:response regulator transcription factor [Gemmataceae bacterium]